MTALAGSSIAVLGWDLHVHAAPSSARRWGTDLDVAHAAEEAGLRGVVVKSHHEQTASRAVLVNDHCRRAGLRTRVIGSVVLNPWIAEVELDRALDLGARLVWWPTRTPDGSARVRELPMLHERALDAVERRGATVATGHLAAAATRRLISACAERGVRVVVTHPLHPELGVGVAQAVAAARDGAIVEVDAHSLSLLRRAGTPVVGDLARLAAAGARFSVVSDGGQAHTGNPFAFLARELAWLSSHGLGHELLEGMLASGAQVAREVTHAR